MYSACMVALQIRDVPDDVRDVLAEQAAARGQSLQAFLLTLVTEEARRARNIVLLQRFGARSDGIESATGDVVAALRAARAEREDELVRRSPGGSSSSRT